MKIAIVGSANFEIEKAIHEHMENNRDLEIVNIEDFGKLEYLKTAKEYLITNPYPVEMFTGEKKFICKGKHQYREVTETDVNLIKHSWVCQCGRKL